MYCFYWIELLEKDKKRKGWKGKYWPITNTVEDSTARQLIQGSINNFWGSNQVLYARNWFWNIDILFEFVDVFCSILYLIYQIIYWLVDLINFIMIVILLSSHILRFFILLKLNYVDVYFCCGNNVGWDKG